MDGLNSIPVTILTGFLGSGKTTVLNRLLKLPQLLDTAVIVNEFGEVGLDHLLLEQAFENAVLLKNGCVCCTVRGDLADTLDTLFTRVREGVIPPFRRIAIETTGLADPGPVAQTLVREGTAYSCRLDGIVTVVDALHGTAQLARQPEARSQVAMADRILITKGDVANPATVEAVVRRLNPAALLRHVLYGEVSAGDIFGLGPQSGALDDRVGRWLGATVSPHGHHGGHHADDIASTLITTDRPIAWDHLRHWLDSLLSTRGADILRLKGLVRIEGACHPLVLQAVHHVLHPPVWLNRAIPDRTEIVLIAQGLSTTGLRESFAAVHTPATSTVGSSSYPPRTCDRRTEPVFRIER